MTRKKKRKHKKHSSFLSGFSASAEKSSMGNTAKETGLALVAGLTGSFVGALFGKWSMFPGALVAGIGVYKKWTWLTAGGIGLAMSNGFQNAKAQTPVAPTEGVDGIKEITEGAKQRVGNFFENFKEKLFLPPSAPTTTDGLGEDDQVTYFVNPYNKGTGDIDTSELERLEKKLDQMNTPPPTNGLMDLDMDREL